MSRAARALSGPCIGALTASAINVVDLEVAAAAGGPLRDRPRRCARRHRAAHHARRPESIDIIFLDERGADLSQAVQRKLERVFSRQEFRRAFPGEIADLTYPPRLRESYAQRAAAPRRHDAASRRPA